MSIAYIPSHFISTVFSPLVAKFFEKIYFFFFRPQTKEKARDAAAGRWPPRPALLLLCVGERHIKFCFLKCRIGHVVQLMDRLLGKLAHILVHVLQGVGDPGKRPVPVGVVVHTDQIFFLYGNTIRLMLIPPNRCFSSLPLSFSVQRLFPARL